MLNGEFHMQTPYIIFLPEKLATTFFLGTGGDFFSFPTFPSFSFLSALSAGCARKILSVYFNIIRQSFTTADNANWEIQRILIIVLAISYSILLSAFTAGYAR